MRENQNGEGEVLGNRELQRIFPPNTRQVKAEIATGYGLNHQRVGIRDPMSQEFSVLHSAQTG
jgi:hypothetical protein